ncbi:MAG: class II aldolase/adducin family protein [Pseudomonadota bacterium]
MTAKVAASKTARQPLNDWDRRVECAAVCRALALRGWDDMAEQFVAVRCESRRRAFLMYEYGTFLEEVRASELSVWDFDGSTERQNDVELNPGTHNVTVGVFDRRPEAVCALHLHTRPIVGVSLLEEGLLPVCHPAFLIRRSLAYVDYVADEEKSSGFREAHAERVGDAKVVIARNHGAYIYASSGAEAFFLAHNLVQACEVQLDVLASGRAFTMLDEKTEAVIRKDLDKCLDYNYRWDGSREWKGLLRRLDREAQGYDT